MQLIITVIIFGAVVGGIQGFRIFLGETSVARIKTGVLDYDINIEFVRSFECSQKAPLMRWATPP